jgi:transposase InsO family protein
MYLRNVNRPGKLQLDIKYVTPELSGLAHTTYLYAVIDIYTRWKAGVILPGLDQALVIEALRYIIPRLPETLQERLDFIQTDNGLEFQQQFLDYITNPKRLKKEAHLQNAISHHYIHKSSPNENAVIERSFRTDEEEFFWRIDRPKDLLELNALYQQYMDEYNTFRPHLGLRRGEYIMTPEEKLIEYATL